jgi:hypothetical protein
MNTKLLMTLSALIMGLIGIILSFFPHEIVNYINSSVALLDALVLQILGASYFGFAMVNWTAKANLIGGIYSRPIAIGNFSHFVIGALALIKGYSSSHEIIVLITALVYGIFGVLFSIVFFTHPIKAAEVR